MATATAAAVARDAGLMPAMMPPPLPLAEKRPRAPCSTDDDLEAEGGAGAGGAAEVGTGAPGRRSGVHPCSSSCGGREGRWLIHQLLRAACTRHDPAHRIKLYTGHTRKQVHDSRIPSLGRILLSRTTVDVSHENVSPSVDESAHCFYVPQRSGGNECRPTVL